MIHCPGSLVALHNGTAAQACLALLTATSRVVPRGEEFVPLCIALVSFAFLPRLGNFLRCSLNGRTVASVPRCDGFATGDLFLALLGVTQLPDAPHSTVLAARSEELRNDAASLECEDRERSPWPSARSVHGASDRMHRMGDVGMQSVPSPRQCSEQCRCTTAGPPADIPNDKSAPRGNTGARGTSGIRKKRMWLGSRGT
ncbi:hypothetical protein MTO96_008500 [Rhipicephalus appendiculatus]